MHKRVVIDSTEDIKKQSKPKDCPSFIINKPAQNITLEQEQAMLQDLIDNMHADRLANGQKDHYFD